jgi:coniferyl-aldehyde dehydrogenase
MTATADAPANDDIAAMNGAFDALKTAWGAGGGLDLKTRRATLKALKKALIARRDDAATAISTDFGNRSRHETLGAEVFLPVAAIRHTLEHLDEWTEPQEREITWHLQPAKGRIVQQPLGVVGIIAPWNYPVQLALLPLIAAISAGNRVLIKPSELTPATTQFLVSLLQSVFTPDQVRIVTGGPDVGAAFSGLPFDHLLFTGSTRVGRLVMQSASKNLTPVTLELGGKSPTIIHDSFPLGKAAERILYGKSYNSGQTCVAPDYVLCPSDKVDAFVEELKKQVASFFPTILANDDYTSIINDHHYARVRSMVDDAREKGATVHELNPANETLPPESRKLALHVVTNLSDDMSVMQEEIFGPILPIVPYDGLDAAIAYVNARPRPLALYYFDRNGKRTNQVLNETTSGGTCVNDTLLHNSQEELPFGGVGPSGMGHYHGYEGFLTFSHAKSVLLQSRLAGTKMLNPPYGGVADGVFRLFIGM